MWSQKRRHKKQRRNLVVALGILDIEGGGSVGEDQQIARLAHQFGGGLDLGPEETLHYGVGFSGSGGLRSSAGRGKTVLVLITNLCVRGEDRAFFGRLIRLMPGNSVGNDVQRIFSPRILGRIMMRLMRWVECVCVCMFFVRRFFFFIFYIFWGFILSSWLDEFTHLTPLLFCYVVFKPFFFNSYF